MKLKTRNKLLHDQKELKKFSLHLLEHWSLLQTLRIKRTKETKSTSEYFVLFLFLLCIGYLISPAELEPTQNGGVTHWGGWALETAFGITLLLAMLITFRALEIIFRTHDAESLNMLPLNSASVAIDRLIVTLKDALKLAFLASAFFLGSIPKGWLLALTSALFPLLGGFISGLVGYGIVASAGVIMANPDSGFSNSVDQHLGEAAGGGLYHFAPGIAFATSSAFILFAKLGLEEPLRIWSTQGDFFITKAGYFALGSSLCIAFLIAIYGLRGLTRYHHLIQAQFRDADTFIPLNEYDYFKNTPQKKTFFIRIFGERISSIFHKDRLTFLRSHSLLRAATIIIAIFGMFIVWGAKEQINIYTIIFFFSTWLVFIATPFRKHRKKQDLAVQLCEKNEQHLAFVFAGTIETSIHGLWLLLPALMTGTFANMMLYFVTIIASISVMMTGALFSTKKLFPAFFWIVLIPSTLFLFKIIGLVILCFFSIGMSIWFSHRLLSLKSVV